MLKDAAQAPEEIGGFATSRHAKMQGWFATLPHVCSALVVASNTPKPLVLGGEGIDLMGVADALVVQAELLQLDDLAGVQAMLSGQAVALQSMFTALAVRATKVVGIDEANATLGMALRAQQQCERTLRTIIEMKQPRASTVFAKTAAVAVGGAQQVNVGDTAVPVARGSAPEAKTPNQLIKKESAHAMDIAGPRGGSRARAAGKALVAIDRTAHRGG